jgi:hypothetical protein
VLVVQNLVQAKCPRLLGQDFRFIRCGGMGQRTNGAVPDTVLRRSSSCVTLFQLEADCQQSAPLPGVG